MKIKKNKRMAQVTGVRHFRMILGMLILGLFSSACQSEDVSFDASGAFEAEEVIISSEASGVLERFEVEEGDLLKSGQVLGYVDSVQLFLQKVQLEARIQALLSKKPNIPIQLAALQEQLKTAEQERERVSQLVKGDAATGKQLDDMEAQIEVIRKQIRAQRSSLSIASDGLNKEVVPLQVQVEQLNDRIQRCVVRNPIAGTVLAKYAEAHEMTGAGKPLYKIADLSHLILRVYISGDQLAEVKLKQEVRVLTDDGQGGMHEDRGVVTWISDQAEFTPKTIQTKEERANRVYAMKVKVANDGRYKIGMYGEIQFQ